MASRNAAPAPSASGSVDVVTVTLNPALDLAVELEELIPYRKLRGDLIAFDPGGGGINVARALRRLDIASLATFTAGGLSGAMLIEEVRRAGVAAVPVPVEARTRQSLTIWTRARRQHFRILVKGQAINEAAWRACLEIVRERSPAGWVVLSGSTPPGLDTDEVIASFAQAARDGGARFACDSSGAALARAVQAGADLVKPSRGELAALVGHGAPLADFDHEAATRAVLARGARAVVVSLGADGAYVAAADGTEATIPAPPVDVLSSVGAGDSMVAGILSGLLVGEPLGEAVRLGVAAGTATCQQHGTELFDPRDVEHLRTEIPVAGGT